MQTLLRKRGGTVQLWGGIPELSSAKAAPDAGTRVVESGPASRHQISRGVRCTAKLCLRSGGKVKIAASYVFVLNIVDMTELWKRSRDRI
jgi:hypothetical protein